MSVFPALRPKLIALDLDGTLLEGLHGPPPAVLNALEACREAGIELAFITGRRPVTAKLGLAAYTGPAHVATGSGCLLWEYPSWRRLETRRLGAELARELATFLAPRSLNFYQDSSEEESGVAHLMRECTPETAACRERFGYAAHAVLDLDSVDFCRVTQIALPCDDALALELRDSVRLHFGERIFALAVRWPLVPCTALEVFSPGANKGSALAYFASRLGVEQSRTLAVGDDVNDIAMLEWAGHGVAMPHANAETAASANVQLHAADTKPSPDVLADYLLTLADVTD